MKNIGARIQQKRKELGISQEDFATLLRQRYGVKTSRSTLAKWESGVQAPRAYVTHCIAEILGVSADWLIRGVEPPAPTSAPALSPNRRALLELAETATDEEVNMLLRLAKAVLAEHEK